LHVKVKSKENYDKFSLEIRFFLKNDNAMIETLHVLDYA